MIKICLSISKQDSDFEKMIKTLSAYAEVDVVGIEDFSLRGYHIFIGKQLREAELETADCLKAVFAYKTGVDDFPLSALKERGVFLVNSHAATEIIAEYAFGLSISLVNRIAESDRRLRKGIWYDRENPYWRSLFQMRVGLLGYGHIGRNVAKILQNNSIKAYTLDRGGDYQGVTPVSSVSELFGASDLIILSLPKTKQTDDMVNAETIQYLTGKYLVNVGRSNCIDQEVLYNALKNGKLAGAAIDTWDEKPKSEQTLLNPSLYPFEELDNIILSPHQAMRVEDGHSRYVEDITEKVLQYMKNGAVADCVDLDAGY